MKRLTRKRAEIFNDYFYPVILSNLNFKDGDMAEAYENYSYEELFDALEAISQLCEKRIKNNHTKP